MLRVLVSSAFVALVVASCGGEKRPIPSPPVSTVTAPTAAVPVVPVGSAPLPDSSADGELLAVGEALLLEGQPVIRADNPSGNALTYRGNGGFLILIARSPGVATFEYADASGRTVTRRFQVDATYCRDTPLHPAIVLGLEERTTLPAAGVVRVDVSTHNPFVASAGIAHGSIIVVGSTRGRTTVIAEGSNGPPRLWDVLVGGVCADKAPPSVATAVPPGVVGPKGDGTCVRRDARRAEVPATCPDPSKLDALSDAELTPIACDWAASCGRMGDEGCCVGCTHPLSMKLSRPCALRSLRARTCAQALAALAPPGCTK